MKPKARIGVVGGNHCDAATGECAAEIGKLIAGNGAVLVCGGLGGVMEAAARGAFENGGTTIGVLPGTETRDANPYITIPLPTGLGTARNVLVVNFSDVIIALPGEYGTLGEIAYALTCGKTVIRLPGAWDLKKAGIVESALFKEAFDPRQALGMALAALG